MRRIECGKCQCKFKLNPKQMHKIKKTVLCPKCKQPVPVEEEN